MATDIETNTIRRVYWRTIPLLFAMMFFNYLDRINIGFAGLRMNQDLAFSPAVFGFGASVFFVGYMLVEVPSNLMLHRLGARIWLARILLSWGAVATAMAFVWSDASFYVLRFALGVAEAGFMPGVVLYITYWFPQRYRARAVAGYIIAGQVAAVIGGPISTTVMTYMDNWAGVHGWQWMFVVEGLPTMVLGLVVLWRLTDRPRNAAWLEPAQREWLENELAGERAGIAAPHGSVFRHVLGDARVWSLAILFGCALVGVYGLLIWMPQIIKSLGTLSDIEVGFLSALPPALGVLGTILAGISSDRTGDRKFHLAGLYTIAAIGLAGSALAPTPVLAYAALCLTGLGVNSGNPLFWSLSASFMTGVSAAASIALVNTIAQFGGLIGPWMIGFVLAAAIIAATMRVTPRASERSAVLSPEIT